MSTKANGLNAQQANYYKQQLKVITDFSMGSKSIKSADIKHVKDELAKNGFADTMAGSRSVITVLTDLETMAGLQEKGTPRKGSDKQWEADLKDLQQSIDTTTFAVAVTDKRYGETTAGINAAAGDGSNDEAAVKKLHDDAYGNNEGKTRVNVTGEAGANYQKLLADLNQSPAELGKAQRQLMLAFQVQYPKAQPAEFQTYMKGVIDSAPNVEGNRRAAATESASAASYSDIAAAAHKNGGSKLEDDLFAYTGQA